MDKRQIDVLAGKLDRANLSREEFGFVNALLEAAREKAPERSLPQAEGVFWHTWDGVSTMFYHKDGRVSQELNSEGQLLYSDSIDRYNGVWSEFRPDTEARGG